MRRLLDAILLLAALAGGVVAWQTGREQARLRAKVERLTRSAGDLPVTDPSRIHVLALDTGEPLHFAWRVYLPAGYDLALVEGRRSGGVVSRSPAGSIPSRELILRVRFREDAQGRLNLYRKNENYSSRGSFGDDALAKVLHGRFEKVLVEQLGANAPVSVGVDEPQDLLRLTLPADMEAEFLKALPPDERAEHNPQFFTLSFGPEAKKPPIPDGGK